MSLGIPKTNTISVFVRGVLAAALFAASVFVGPSTVLATHLGTPDPSFDANKLIDDESFVAKDAMSSTDIQSFLQSKGSALATYSENGKSAAQIIYDYTRGTQDPDGGGSGYFSLNVSVHPGVILSTIQKESSLITSGNLNYINSAMGFGCPDGSGCDSQYSGFTNQVKYGAWQLYRNYVCADPSCTDYSNRKVGQTECFTNTQDYDVPASQCVTHANKATAGLYRYTPHVFNGNYNFWKNFKNWFSYSAQYVTQYSQTKNGQTFYPTIAQGMSAKFVVQLKNVGGQTWNQGTVNLGTDRGRDRIPGFIREDKEGGSASGWLKENRVQMKEASVAPGSTATFEFWYTVPDNMTPGTYREYFRPVADGVQWMDDWGIYWDVKVISKADSYRARWYSQDVNAISLARGEKHQFEVKFENTGISTWTRGAVNLGTDRPRDRIPGFLREGGSPSGWLNHDRIEMVEASVPPGGVGTFRFWYTVTSDKAPGVYKEYFRPVADFITWMDDWGVYFEITVP